MCVSVAVSSVASSSSPALTVTVCAVPQSDVVNVRLDVFNVRSVPETPVTATVTVAVGSDDSATV